MERKYYLRGLGIGIVVTAIIMGIALPGDGAMTDKEIIARAKELGMVENTVLSGLEDASDKELEEGAEAGQEDPDKAQENAADPVDEGQQDAAQAANEGTVGSGDSDNTGDGLEDGDHTEAAANQEEQPVSDEQMAAEGGEAEVTESGGEEESASENTREQITSATVKTITINSGDGSHTVAKKLMDVGVVTSVEAFDSFLCEHGYDKRLRTGTFSIPADASDEQIARIVTGAE